MSQDKVQVSDAPETAHQVNVAEFFPIDVVSYLTFERDRRRQRSVNTSRQCGSLGLKTERFESELDDLFKIGSGID